MALYWIVIEHEGPAVSALPDFGVTSCSSRRSTTSLTKDLGEVISSVEMSRILL